MARGIPKSTKEIGVVATMADIDEILINAKIAGRWYTKRIAFDDFKTLLSGIIETGLCDWPNCPVTSVNTGAEYGDLYLYDAKVKSFLLVDLNHCLSNIIFGVRDTADAYLMSFLTEISAPVLVTIDGKLRCMFQSALLIFSMPSLTDVVGDVKVAGNPALASLVLDALTNVGGDYDVSANANATARIPPNVTGNILCGGAFLVSVDVSAMVTWAGTTFNARDSALPAAAVNAILIKLDAMGVLGRTIQLDLGANAAPTGAGATAKAALISAGNTVTTN